MAKIYFERDFDGAPAGKPDCDIYTLGFFYDTKTNEIIFDEVMQAPGASTVAWEWIDFLKKMGQEANGTYVDNIYKLAEAHVELNLEDALADEE